MTSPDIPPQAITAAAQALHDARHHIDCDPHLCDGNPAGADIGDAKTALAAAAPHLAAAERERRLVNLIGYCIGEQIYHPEDVMIVYREQP